MAKTEDRVGMRNSWWSFCVAAKAHAEMKTVLE